LEISNAMRTTACVRHAGKKEEHHMKTSRPVHFVLSTLTLGLGLGMWVGPSSADHVSPPPTAAEVPPVNAAPPPTDPGAAGDATAGDETCDDATELGEMKCPKSTWGADCMMNCAIYGVSCPAGMRHNVTQELGKLYKCCNCKEDKRCWYAYENGDFCVLPHKTRKLVCGLTP
jgi:hypothetical protein